MVKPVLRFLRLAAVPLCLLAVSWSGRPAQSCEYTGFCIEYTVFNPETCHCECPDQDCCAFYYPFIPYGC